MENLPFDHVVETVDDLRSRYRDPVQAVREKKRDRLEPWLRACIEASPIAFIATADEHGRTTVSPRGGAPGFVTVLDEQRLAIPDYAGNNLLDSLRNVLANPRLGIVFLLPGRGETVRVDGDAWITVDPSVLDACQREGRRPKVAVGVRVEDAFLHCPSSLERSAVWDPSSWPDDTSLSFDDFVRRRLPPEHASAEP